MGILAIITARKGSKGIACKNFRKIGGYSLTEHAVLKAVELLKRGYVENIYVSSDSEYLCEKASHITGVRYELRRPELSFDSVKSIDVVKNVIELFEGKGKTFSDVLIMQPTSPLCAIDDYCKAIDLYNEQKAQSMISVYRIENINPNGLYFINSNNIAIPLINTHSSGTRRQDLQKLYLRNGAIFITNVSYMKKYDSLISETPLCYQMLEERSVNIDCLNELNYANNLWCMGKKTKVLEVSLSRENIKCCDEMRRKYDDIQIIYEELYYKTFSYCLKMNKDDYWAAKEYWLQNIYLNGETVFLIGDDVTKNISSYECTTENNAVVGFVSELEEELLKGSRSIVVKKGITLSDDSSKIRQFCYDVCKNKKMIV